MRGALKSLYDLQIIDLHLLKAQKAKASLDDGSAKKQQVESARQEAEKAENLYHEASAELHDKDLNLKSVESKRKAFSDKLYGGSVTNPKELESMEKEIEMLGRQKDKLEERMIELFDIIEERKSTLASAQAALKQQEDELAAHLEKLRREDASLAVRISDLLADREKALPEVEPALLRRYEAMRVRTGGVVVSKVEDESCSACHTQVMSGAMRELQTDKTMQTCENCGRLLYLEQ
jgi:predicted  nucleic acid-binding Zn-ribbon protein